MNAKTLTGLILAALVAAGVAYWATQSRAPQRDTIADTAFLPGLSATVNDVRRVEIRAGEAAATTLVREDVWRVAEKGNYRADIGKLREFLIALADAKVLERKTSNPDNYPLLGVAEVGADEGAASAVKLTGATEREILLGKTARGGDAVYARRAGEEASWLISGNPGADADPLDWLDKDIIDVAAKDIQSVTIEHPGGAKVEAARAERGQANVGVANLPAGKELSTVGAANSIANVLQRLRCEDVVSAEGFEFDPAATITTTYRTFDGLQVVARALAKEEEYFVAFDASFDQAQAERFVVAEVATGTDPETLPSTDAPAVGAEESAPANAATPASEPAAPDFSAAIAQAAEIDARVDGWVYRLPKYKFEQMSRQMDDLIKKEE